MNLKELGDYAFKELGFTHVCGGFGGWIYADDMNWMCEFLTTNYTRDAELNVMELGVFQGSTSNMFLCALPKCTFYVVDNFSEGPPSPPYKSIREGFLAMTTHFKDRIKLHEGDSKEIGKDWNTKLDICLIDGCHNGDYPEADINNFAKHVVSGGYLLVDDYSMKDVGPAVNSLLKNNPNEWELIRTPVAGMSDVIVFKRK